MAAQVLLLPGFEFPHVFSLVEALPLLPMQMTERTTVDAKLPHVVGHFGQFEATQEYVMHAAVAEHARTLDGFLMSLSMQFWSRVGALSAAQAYALGRVEAGRPQFVGHIAAVMTHVYDTNFCGVGVPDCTGGADEEHVLLVLLKTHVAFTVLTALQAVLFLAPMHLPCGNASVGKLANEDTAEAFAAAVACDAGAAAEKPALRFVLVGLFSRRRPSQFST